MSRSGYVNDLEAWTSICWRGAVKSAIRGKRGQAFLQEMLAAFDAMPEKALIAHDLEKGGAVCAIGAVGAARGVDMSQLDPEDYDTIAGVFGISHALTREIFDLNDEPTWLDSSQAEAPCKRFDRMRTWVERHIKL